MWMQSPKARLEMNEDRNEIARTKELVDLYLRNHSKLSRQMTENYKQDSINNVIIELFCKDNNKYVGKHRDLIERARFGDTSWR